VSYLKINIDQSIIWPYPLYQLRNDFPNTSFPQPYERTEDLSDFFVYPVSPTPRPEFNDITHTCEELLPVLSEGVWVQQWSIVPRTPEDVASELSKARKKKWEAIKAIRDEKINNGGFPVDGKWFHSDMMSRTQQLGLKIMGNDVPNVGWKTMDGSFVNMSPSKASQIFEAAAAQDMALFTYAETLKYQIDNAADPASVPINDGWPATYGG